MKSTSKTLIRRAGAGVSAGALVTASLLLATAPAQASSHTHTITPNLIDQTDTRSAGHNVFSSTGVHIYTDDSTSQAKAAGYFDVDQSLAYIGEPTMDWTGTSPAPGKQLVVDFDGNGTTDGILVGEDVYTDTVGTKTVPDWWLPTGSASQFVKDGAPRTTGGSGSGFHGTLAEWRDAFPDAKVFQTGWSLGSGIHGDGTISYIKLGDETYNIRAGDTNTTTLHRNNVDLTSTRAAGHNTFQLASDGGGVHVVTDGNTDTDGSVNTDKAAGYFPLSGSLAAVGIPTMDVTNNAPGDSNSYVPGTQTEVDLDGDGVSDGTLVGESSYAPLFWLSKYSVNGNHTASDAVKADVPRKPGHDGAPSYSNGAGTMSEWNHAFPDAQVLQGGWSLGSGAKGDATIHSLTYGINTYEFSNRAPVAPDVTQTVSDHLTAQFPVGATDADGPLTYTVSGADGEASIDSDGVITYDADGTTGSDSFTYTVTDTDGATDHGDVDLTIAANVPPVAPEARGTVQAGATVELTMPATDDDGDTLSYSAVFAHGTGSFDDGVLTFTADANFHGRTTFPYSVSDGAAGPVQGTVSINVGRADSHVALTTTPATPTTHQTVTVHVVVTSTGLVHPGVVNIYDGTKLVGTGKAHTNGLVDIKLASKLTKGTHTIRAKYLGTTYTNAKSHSIQVVVS